MYNITKMKILKPAHDVFEAFVDPGKIGNFWFSSSSERWEQGKTITLRYDEFNAEGQIQIVEIEKDKKIVFNWGNTVTISLQETEPKTTIVEIIEEGFDENDPQLIEKLLDNKEGWAFMLTNLKAYLENGIRTLRTGLMK
ncbi:SRPBCC family protein [Tuberibacillus calidus]|uniref:SRPBCC family protein n=1 Tax=Tuberibacillus calidus TaxID=340097 RepID=UPI000428F70E|nr:SRPBCC family protein [Tuberibacillus calidus]